MLIDRTHQKWGVLTVAAFAGGLVAYLIYDHTSPNGATGGSFPGLCFGVAAAAMMLFAGLLGARRSARHRRFGTASFWLKGHLWLGALSVPYALFHAGFEWGGLFETIMWLTLIGVTLSGIFGLIVQQVVPRMLWNDVPLESFEMQTPWLRDRNLFLCDLQVSKACELPLEVPPDHMSTHRERLVDGFRSIVDDPGVKRNEQNARKLELIQRFEPAEAREFFWSVAKYTKNELRLLRFEGDFPELLQKTYQDLDVARSQAETSDTAKSKAADSTQSSNQTPETTPGAAPTQSSPAPVPNKTSPLDLLRRKSEEGKGPSAPTVVTSLEKTGAPASPPAPLSPMDAIRAGAGSKTKTTPDSQPPEATSPESTAQSASTPKLSPLELMRKGKAGNATASNVAPATATTQSEATADKQPQAVGQPSAVKSPLDLLKKKSAPAGNADKPTKPAGSRPSVVPPIQPRAPETPALPPSASDKQLLREFYLSVVRPFLDSDGRAVSADAAPMKSQAEASLAFQQAEAGLPKSFQTVLQQLENACTTHRQLTHQRRLLRWMHWWLVLHIPISVVLLVLLAIHVIMALRVVPFG